MANKHQHVEELEQLLLEKKKEQAKLIVYNDEVNTFDWVIECFVQVCQHSPEQAEQLSYMVHFKGKATVKTGDFEKLRPMKDALLERGLSAIIEQ